MNANTSNKLSKGFYRAAIAVAAIGIAAAGPAIQAKPNPNIEAAGVRSFDFAARSSDGRGKRRPYESKGGDVQVVGESAGVWGYDFAAPSSDGRSKRAPLRGQRRGRSDRWGVRRCAEF